MPKLIIDEFSGLPVSRQRIWQLRRERDGFCRKCGVVQAVPPSAYCPRCDVIVHQPRKPRTVRLVQTQYSGI